jgi:2-amino-4-hydroxy-6-hydroxymethyldihydropteridine diphosphokinase
MNDYAIIALGSNLGNSRDLIEQAVRRLAAFSSEPLLRSSLRETEPVDCPPNSPPFINAVVALKPRPDETPESLLAKLQELEREFGRQRKKVHNEPRPLDLDLITFRNEVRKAAQLTLPHPRAHLREFVLGPLKEINPAFAAQLIRSGALV